MEKKFQKMKLSALNFLLGYALFLFVGASIFKIFQERRKKAQRTIEIISMTFYI